MNTKKPRKSAKSEKKKRQSGSIAFSHQALPKVRKIFFPIFSIVAFLNVVFATFVNFQTISEFTQEKVGSVVYNKVFDEQLEHVAGVEENLQSCEKTILGISEHIFALEDGKSLSNSEKQELSVELKKLEENAFIAERQFDEYFEDHSIQRSQGADGRITSFVYETSLLQLALSRFVRTTEASLLSGFDNKTQKSMVVENYYDILWQLDHLEQLKQQ